MLRVAEHRIERAKFPVIDFHNHIDGMDPADVLSVMDACGIEHLVNITMKPGTDGIESLTRLRQASPERFSTIAWMDWRDLGEDGFFERSIRRLERCVAAGAIGMKIWKDLGLRLRGRAGSLLRIDDARLDTLFARAAELGVFIMFHTADPAAFFLPTDAQNERFEELSAHPDWSFYGSAFSREELLEQRNRVFARHPKTQFIAAHMGEQPEDLAAVAAMLEAYPNVQLDMSARVAELGRQPFTARRFLLRFADRILFGADLLPEEAMYRAHYRFFETEDEYFDYPSHASRQGRWQIYGLALPDPVLERIYRGNALTLLARR
jgi:predicted TIM-barrel fold metal-dependent hydrolase